MAEEECHRTIFPEKSSRERRPGARLRACSVAGLAKRGKSRLGQSLSIFVG